MEYYAALKKAVNPDTGKKKKKNPATGDNVDE